MSSNPRSISWIKAARKAFERFPETVQTEALAALTIAAEGEKSDIAKPLKGLGAGVLEIAIRHRGDAWRVVYAVKLGRDVWVITRFRKSRRWGLRHRPMRSSSHASGSSD